jgi:hypothetical protein
MIAALIRDEIRLLTFRRPSAAIHQEWKKYLAFGLFFAWLAGIGRYWDNPKAHLWQYLGLGSVVYVFVLALIIWLLVWPLRPRNWSYRNVLTFVSLTSPPAVLYAIPVERFLPLEQAQTANASFLAVVALWRVALYVVFLRRAGGLSIFRTIVATLLPLVLIVFTLAMLNLEHVVFNLMSGIKPEDRSPNDGAYRVVFTLAYFSFLSAPVLGVIYFFMAVNGFVERRRQQRSASIGPGG